MKKKFHALLAILLTLCMVLPTSVAFADTGSDDWRTNLKTVADGKLTVATSPDFAPYEFYSIDANGNPTLSGFDMDLAKYIADYLGLELEIVTVDFDGVLSELQTKSVDLGMAGLSPSEERKAIMDFSDLYYQGGQALVTVKANADKFTSLEDINNPDVTVGAQTGSIQLDLANEHAANANIVSMPKVTDIVSELISGKEDAAFIEKDVALCYQMNYPDLTLVCDVPYDAEGSAIGVCKGNASLLAAVNEAIAAAVSDNSMNKFVADANELATGKTYEGLLVDGQIPGSSAAEPEAEEAEAAVEAHSFDGLTTVADGKLTVATSPDFAPYEFYSIDASGNPTLSGFDMGLAQYIADYLGLDLEIVTVDFDGVLSELQTKSVDLGMAGLSPSEERKAIMDFSDLYYQGGQALVTVKANADKFTSLEDINKPDVTVGAQTGSIQLDLANEYAADSNIVSMPKVTDIVSELISGKEDAAFIEKDVALCYQMNYPDLTLVCDVPYEAEGSAIGVCKGNAELLAAVNEAIASAVSDNSMNQFVADANELATGKTYEGLLVDGQIPGSAGGEEAAPAATVEAHEYEGLTTVADGKLTVATSPDFAPYEFYSIAADGTPTLAGFDMAMAQYIADYLGLELDVITVDFDGVLSELQTKSVDLGMAGLSPNEERKAIMDFSDIYYFGGQSLVTVKANADQFTSLEDANQPDITVGAQTGSIQLELANTHAADANIVSMPKVTDIISELLSGKEDVAFIETDVAKCYQKNYPELTIVCDVPYEAEGSAIGVCKGNAVLLTAVNDAIASALENGQMEQFVADANELASGEKYEGLLEDMEASEEEAVAETTAPAEEKTSFIKLSNFKTVGQYKTLFVQGVIVTVLLSIFTVLIGFVLGIILALMRLSSFRPLYFLALNEEGFEEDGGIKAAIGKFNPLAFLATAYVEILRSTPVLVQIFIIYYGVFGVINLPSFTIFGFIKFNRFLPGIVALGMNSAAYLSEIIRSGIQSVDGGQTEAARSLGMSQIQNLRYIVLPQALTNILPAIANEFVVIIKESSITYTIGVQDIMSAVQAVKGAAFVITEPLLVATALYFCLCFPTSKIIAYFERRMSRGNKR